MLKNPVMCAVPSHGFCHEPIYGNPYLSAQNQIEYSFPETKKFDGYHLAGWYDEKENGRLYDETSIVTEGVEQTTTASESIITNTCNTIMYCYAC